MVRLFPSVGVMALLRRLMIDVMMACLMIGSVHLRCVLLYAVFAVIDWCV